MFEKHSENGYRLAIKGVERKTLVYGEKTLTAKFMLKKDSTIPLHAHPHEQAGYLLKGHLRFSVGTEKWDAQPGDAWCFPGGVEHGVEIMEDSVVIEVFSPVREDYLPKEKEIE
jgi:quercetin dioxygenase-like cupin family protein